MTVSSDIIYSSYDNPTALFRKTKQGQVFTLDRLMLFKIQSFSLLESVSIGRPEKSLMRFNYLLLNYPALLPDVLPRHEQQV